MEYKPLDTTTEEIRLITILPTPQDARGRSSSNPQKPNQENLIHCNLEHYSLAHNNWSNIDESGEGAAPSLDWVTEDCQELSVDMAHTIPERKFGKTDGMGVPKNRFTWGDFVALSYAWGERDQKKEIVVNGKRVIVQANLEAALRVLQHKKPIKSRYRIWIDALCINQEDIDERDLQVKRMRLIYKLARDVVVWLGPEADDSSRAMDLIHTLSNSCKSGTDKALGMALRQYSGLLGRGVWVAFSKLLERPYWNRMWIIQELSMGGQRAPILCGHKTVIWEDFFRAIYKFGQHNVDVLFACINLEREAAGLGQGGLNRNRIIHIDLEHHTQAGLGDPQFMCLLDLARKSDATDQRDKVYGILGLMEPAVSTQIDPDYNLPVEEVYISFTQKYIYGTRSLEILEQCRWVENDLPSWVPDWRKKNHYRLFSGSHSTYHASGMLTPFFRFRNDDRILDVHGLMIDSIDGLGRAYFEQHTSPRPEHAIFQPENSTNGYGSEESLRDALWRTLTGDRTTQGHAAPDSYECLLDLPLKEHYPYPLPSRGARAFGRFVTQSASLSVAGKRLDSYFTSAAEHFPQSAIDAVERLWRFSRTQRLVFTRNGRLGMAPNEAQKSDIVCILLGCDVPVLVRLGENENDPVRIVGSCYIHGIMAGEATGWINEGEVEVRTISIC